MAPFETQMFLTLMNSIYILFSFVTCAFAVMPEFFSPTQDHEDLFLIFSYSFRVDI